MNKLTLLIIFCFLSFSFVTDNEENHPFDQVINKQKQASVKKRLHTFRKEGIERNLIYHETSLHPDTAFAKVDLEKIISTAKSYLGTRHAMGGSSKRGIDCSGLVMVSLRSCGIKVPHNSHDQGRYGRVVAPMDSLKRGDLVFFIHSFRSHYLLTHSGIYLGNKKFIHASARFGVIVSDVNDSYWGPRFVFGTRIKE
ncbi:MAG: C40 family peptidase [Cytophagales bacterium]